MADLRPIDFPHHLLSHSLTEQELANLTPGQQALAKDWNVMNRKMDWVMQEMVTQHNILVEHDRLLDTFKKWLWLAGYLTLGSGGVGGAIYLVLKTQ